LNFGGQTAIVLPDSPLAGLSTFTLEAWVQFDDLFAGQQVLLEHVGKKNDYWRLMLDRWGRLMLLWMQAPPAAGQRAALADRACGAGGEDAAVELPRDGVRICRSVHLADVIEPRQWYHLVATNMELRLIELCLTPIGRRSPRPIRTARFGPMAWKGSDPGRLLVGGTAQKGEFFHGSVCDLAVFPHAKRRNEFPALGQRPPRRFSVTGNFPLSSVLLPVETGPNGVCVGCRPAPYQPKSFWFYGRFDRVKGREIEMEIVAWPDSTGMLAAPWVSYDRRQWRHLRNAYWCYEEPNHSGMFFRHRFNKSPAYVAVSLPYGLEEIDLLEREVKGSRHVQVIVASHSTEGRPIRLFQATDPDAPDKGKRAMYFQAGQHSPCEMLGGRALDAAVRLCARPPAWLRAVLRRAVLLFVPVVNQDTAFHGGSSSVACGVNLNRDWWQPKSSEVRGLKRYLLTFHRKVAPIQMACDFHAGGGWRAHTVLARSEAVNEAAFSGSHAIQERWLRALANHGDFSPRDIIRETRDHQDHPVNRGIFTTAMRHQHHICGVVAELSPVLYWSRRRGTYSRLTQRAMERMGADLLRAVEEFLGA
jgi:hypothetical protein